MKIILNTRPDITPQKVYRLLGYQRRGMLSKMEMDMQLGLGIGHGLVGILEIEKI